MADEVKKDQEKNWKEAADKKAASKKEFEGKAYFVFEKETGIRVYGPDKALIHRQTDGKILRLDKSDPNDRLVIAYLSKDRKLEALRGRQVKSLDEAAPDMTLAERLDELLSMSVAQCIAMLPKKEQRKDMTRGQVLSAIIKKEVEG